VFAGRAAETFRLRLAQNQRHGLDKFGGPAPVALNLEVAEAQFALLLARRDPPGAGDNFLGHETGGPQAGLVVEEQAGAGEQPVGLAIVGHFPKRRRLGHGVGAARPKRHFLVGRRAPGVAEALARAGVVKTDLAAQETHRLENVQRAQRDAFERFHRLIEGESHR